MAKQGVLPNAYEPVMALEDAVRAGNWPACGSVSYDAHSEEAAFEDVPDTHPGKFEVDIDLWGQPVDYVSGDDETGTEEDDEPFDITEAAEDGTPQEHHHFPGRRSAHRFLPPPNGDNHRTGGGRYIS